MAISRVRKIDRAEAIRRETYEAIEACRQAGGKPPDKLIRRHIGAHLQLAELRREPWIIDGLAGWQWRRIFPAPRQRARRQARPRARTANRSNRAIGGGAATNGAAPRRRRSAARKKAAAEPEPAGGEALAWRLGPLMNVDGTLATVQPDAIAERVLKHSRLWPLLGSQTRWALRQLFRARPFTPADAEAVDRVIACATGCRLPGRAWWPAISGPIPTLALLVRVEGVWRIVAAEVDLDVAMVFATRGNA